MTGGLSEERNEALRAIAAAIRGEQRESPRRWSLTLNPRDPGVPLDLMAELWQAVDETAERLGYRAFILDATGAGVVWFERAATRDDSDDDT